MSVEEVSRRGAAPASAARPGQGALALIACLLIAAFDGFDIQAMGFVAPRLAETWGMPVAEFAPVFSIGLLGLPMGSLLLAPLGDRFGRKTMVLLGTLWVVAATIATAFCDNLPQLIAARFATGVGLGAAMPILVAIAHEAAPPGRSVLFVSIMTCAIPAGGFLGGVIASIVLPLYGWSIFFAGLGFTGLLLVAPLAFFVRSTKRTASPQRSATPMVRFGALIPSLFQSDLRWRTTLLWILYVSTLFNIFALANWLPTLLERVEVSAQSAAMAASFSNLGGLAGGILLGWFVSKRGAGVLVIAYGLAAVLLVALGMAGGSVAFVTATAFAIGFFILGGQVCNTALASSLYGASARATGVGWAQGVGRLGAIIGPALIGVLLIHDWTNAQILTVTAMVALLAATAAFLLRNALSVKAGKLT